MKEHIKDCVKTALEKLLSRLSHSSCIDTAAAAAERLQPLVLPYSTRGARLKSVLLRRIVEVGECGFSIVAFEVSGSLREYLLVCAAPRIEVLLEGESTYADELSGLNLRIRKPVLLIGDCRVEFEWRRTSMVLKPKGIEECRYCEKIPC